jgi:hypothetical protein
MSTPRPSKRSPAVRRDIAQAQRKAVAASTPIAKVVTRQVVESKHRAAGLKPPPKTARQPASAKAATRQPARRGRQR